MKPRILVIDDEAAIRDSVRMILEYEGYECQLAPGGQEGIAIVEKDPPDLVFLDIKMPGMDGLEALGRLKELNERVPVVIISGHGTVSTAVEATKLGAFDFIEKPLASERVLVTIRNALDQHKLRDENRSLRRAIEIRHELIGSTAALGQVMDAIGRAAPTNATVLIRGESGVGKELVARAIHRNSLRAKERFVQVNCAAIPEDLIESELFGHEKGSFTGATEKQIGKFEQADRGTIFLDEVGDMSLRTQAKVLRVLQEGEVERLGSARTMKVDVRVIAATNKNLEEEIEKGTFREDLYFRLSVIPIYVAPLRERAEDIPLLVRHFVDLFSRENNFKPKRFTPAATDALVRNRWKGNVRELRNTIERLIIMTPGDLIDERDVRETVRIDARSAVPDNSTVERPSTLRQFKELSERVFLVEKLRENGWNISKTAEAIGTPRSNLYKKLDQYNIRQETDS
ncbi:MAG: sigma-54-dependent Fis family transcriptional regulator [Acidobacteria bacterium]|nr:sigma-54-dependent Fis family transcriptional regulator [Acidobacteriota bacterium]